MSFEQLDTQEQESKKKKKMLEYEKSQQFFSEKQILQESIDLLQKLALQIAQEFGIDISQAKKLIWEKTEDSLKDFQRNLWTSNSLHLENFEKAIMSAKNSLKDLSKKTRDSLRHSLERDTYHPETHEYTLSQSLFSDTLLQKIQYPQSIRDQIFWAGIGLIDSTEAIILFTYALGKGILLTPYHIYLMITGQARYDGWKKI